MGKHPDLCDEDIVSLGEGFTPLVPMPSLGAALGVADLWIKQCGHNPTGSFKDLGMTGLVSQVQRLRRLGHRIPAVACASTGDTSAALAAYCAQAGLPSLVFLPAGKLSDGQLTQPLCSHSLTVAIDADFDRCMELVAAFCAAHGVYLANSMNPLRIEGQRPSRWKSSSSWLAGARLGGGPWRQPRACDGDCARLCDGQNAGTDR